jgi:hypothetical protein
VRLLSGSSDQLNHHYQGENTMSKSKDKKKKDKKKPVKTMKEKRKDKKDKKNSKANPGLLNSD